MALAFPGADGFERAEPAAVGLDATALESAVDHALAHESPVARDFSDHRERLAGEEGDRGPSACCPTGRTTAGSRMASSPGC